MRVMVAVSDWTTHWLNVVPLAWALQAAGHEVRLVCPPLQTEPASRAGLVPVEILQPGELVPKARMHNHVNARAGHWPYAHLPPDVVTGEPVAALADFDPFEWIGEHKTRMIESATRSADAAVDFARWWRPNLVLHDLMCVEGPLAARVLGVPSVLTLWGPVGPDDEVPGVPGLRFLAVDVSRAFQRHDVGEWGPDAIGHVLDPCPPGLRPSLRADTLPIRQVPYNGPGPWPRWLQEPPARPRVCVVWGTSVSTVFGAGSFPVPRLVEALSELDVEVVFTVTGPDHDRIGHLPERMRAVRNVPLHLLLPTSDLVVHHGGGGSTMTALAAGVPQLVLPPGGDQELIGARIEAAGIGRTRHNAVADAGWLHAATAALIGEPGYRSAADRLRQEAADRPTPSAVVADLVALATVGNSPRP
ncbi:MULTISPECIES: nucleotide disphospho-sugar-binding domain-containing protein [unclassified Micromonospora]|uniref:nucleotide disphospho-sugar-binding domain-containing protein n=1 Tax=unclassified Micromonospora TaxID=2617518 RepID=UPI00363C02C3